MEKEKMKQENWRKKAEGMNIICIICARGGSKGVPGKNIKDLAGKPLIAHTIAHAKACKLIRRVIVSTDDKKIADTAKKYSAEVPFIRPAEMATDTASKFPALNHAIKFVEEEEGKKVDIVIDLDPTSVLRKVEDIEGCIKKLLTDNTDSVVTVYEAHHNPYFNMLEFREGTKYLGISKKPKKPITRRQDAPKVFQMNAVVFCAYRNTLVNKNTYFTEKMTGYVMPEERSLMIDTPLEFKMAELIMNELKEKEGKRR